MPLTNQVSLWCFYPPWELDIFCSFRLVLEGKTGKEIPESSRLEIVEKFSGNNFDLSDAENNTSGLLNRGGIVNLPLLRTQLAICQKSWAKFLGSDGCFCFIRICKLRTFTNPFAMITSLAELYFRFRKFILLLLTKKVISMNYGSSLSSWKPWRWVRLDFILLMRHIHINLNLNPFTKFTSNRRITEFKDILPWNIS